MSALLAIARAVAIESAFGVAKGFISGYATAYHFGSILEQQLDWK